MGRAEQRALPIVQQPVIDGTGIPTPKCTNKPPESVKQYFSRKTETPFWKIIIFATLATIYLSLSFTTP